MRAAFTQFVKLALASALAIGCGSDGGVDLRIDVRTDWVPVAEFSEIEVSLDGSSETVIYDARFDDDFLTGVRVATLENVKQGQVTVRARILAEDGRRLVERRVTASVNGPTTLTLVFTRSCAAVSCPDGDPSATECVGGRCVSPECSPENPDACGDGGCESDDECGDAPVGCARTICTDGECFVGSDFAACAATEYCNPEDGCQPRPVDESDGGTSLDGGMSVEDAGPIDMGPPEECGMPCDTGNACETGVYDCSSGEPICVRDSLVAAGTTCREAAGECDVAESCDGASPTCPMDSFEETGTACSAGFCDGLGTCSDTCSPGADCSTGNPCETGTIDCSGGTPSCVRSGDAPNGTSCGTTENGPFGSCGGFSSSCDETGTRSRTVTRYECQSASCDANTTMETRGCSRNTDGDGCGTVTYGSWGSCGGYSNTCDETGSRTRDVYTPTCSGGSCSTVTTTQSGSCSRNTDGTTCASTDFGTYGTCRYDSPCDETGSQMRTNTEYECASGACQGNDVIETQPCTRNTDGLPCLGSPFGCNDYMCASGSCQSYYRCKAFEQCCDDICTEFACP